MRKRDALKMALWSLKLPKLSESEKLLYAGITAFLVGATFAIILTALTKNVVWVSLLVIGCLIFAWFGRASEIMDEWEWKTMFCKANEVMDELKRKMMFRRLREDEC